MDETSSNKKNSLFDLLANSGLYLNQISEELDWFGNQFNRTGENRDIREEEEVLSFLVARDIWKGCNTFEPIRIVDPKVVAKRQKVLEEDIGSYYDYDEKLKDSSSRKGYVSNPNTILRLVKSNVSSNLSEELLYNRELYNKAAIAVIGTNNKLKWQLIRGHINPVCKMKQIPNTIRRGIHEILTHYQIIPEALELIEEEVNSDVVHSIYFPSFCNIVISEFGEEDVRKRFFEMENKNR